MARERGTDVGQRERLLSGHDGKGEALRRSSGEGFEKDDGF